MKPTTDLFNVLACIQTAYNADIMRATEAGKKKPRSTCVADRGLEKELAPDSLRFSETKSTEKENRE